jgi:transposase
MARRSGAVHVVTTKRQHKGKEYVAHLLRRSYREDGKVKNETVANLSHLPGHVVDLIRQSLRGQRFVEVGDTFDIVSSPQHGNVQAVLTAMRSLDLSGLIGSRPSRERDLVMAMIAARVLSPQSKLATTRWWHDTTLPRDLGVADATEDDLYAAMDWLLVRQPTIEKKLASRHLHDGGMVLYDLSSSYFEGTKCPLAAPGYSRDGKKGTLQVNYGLVTDAFGCPVSVSVFPGNTGDPKTVLEQVEKVQSRFGIESMVLVGDRGMITQKQIDQIRERPGIEWVTALRSPAIKDLVQREALQLGLFDERNLFELVDIEYPGERLVACRNLDLAERRRLTRQSLLEATSVKLDQIKRAVEKGRLRGKDKIGMRVGRVINTHKVGKHFVIDIQEASLSFTIDQDRVREEAALDGIYVIRTSLPSKALDTNGVVETYKRLSSVERAFRSLKTIDLHVRPIRHWNEDRVRAHIFLCMLAFYVQYHMQEAWRSLLFFDEEVWTRTRVDPVAPARRSAGALQKTKERLNADGQPVHSFRTLLAHLGGIVCNICRRKGANVAEPDFQILTQPGALQKQALDLIASISA